MDLIPSVGGALFGTSAWAIAMSNIDAIDIRIPIAVSGVISAVSLCAIPPSPHACAITTNAMLGALLLTYQWCLSVAFNKGGSIVQAIVNCNVILIYAYSVATNRLPFSIENATLAVCTCVTTGIMVVINHPPATIEIEP